MAQRYSGAYSPNANKQSGGGAPGGPPPRARPMAGQKPTKAGARVNFTFILPLAFLIRAFASEPVAMATYLFAAGLLLLAAWMTREGLKAEDAYAARKVARRPAMPRKIFGSVLTGLGLAVAGLAGHGMTDAIIFGVLGTALHFGAFGPDPMKDKGMEGIDTFQQDRVARAVEEGLGHLDAMQDAILRTRDRDLQNRVDSFGETARTLFRTVEDDPRDLTAARKYLGVYLKGARDAAVKYTELTANGPNPDARASFIALLDDLDSNFAARTKSLLLDDRTDLDVEISVLRDRLAREGVRVDP
jgi:hypothetical protein